MATAALLFLNIIESGVAAVVILLDRWGNTKHGLLTLANIEDTDKLFVSIVDITEKKRTDRIISVINKISQLMVHEKDTEHLFMAVCQEFRALKHQFVAAVALCAGKDLVPVAISDDAYEYLNAACLGSTWVREALRESFVKMPVESELRGNPNKTVTAYAFPMHNSDEPRGILMMYALTEADLNHNELESLQALAHDIASAIKSLELETQKRVALEQIEKNMTQLAILNDNIRNPLQTMVGWADLEGGKLADIVIEQANEINDIVKRLDQGWIESEKIREFLHKHYNIERNGKL